LMGLSPGLVLALVAIMAVAAGKMLRSPLLHGAMNEHIGSHNRATILSSVSMLKTMFTAVIYIPVGMLADYSLNAALIALGLMTLAFALLSARR